MLALRFGPGRLSRHAGHGFIAVGNRFKTAILRVRTTGLKRHHETLTGCMHHGMGNFKAALVQTIQNFQTDTGTAFNTRITPGLTRFFHRRQQLVHIHGRVLNVHLDTVRGHLGTGATADTGHIQLERLVQMGLERGLAVFSGGFTIGTGARVLGPGAEVVTAVNRFQCAVQCRFMLGKKILAHQGLPLCLAPI